MRFLLQPPINDQANETYPLWIVLHGAFATAEQATTLFGQEAARHNAFLLAPEGSRPCGDGYCWSFARDAQAIHRIVAMVRTTYAINPNRLSVIGYSMGCTMGLWLIAQHPRQFAFFAALGMGSAFEPWEHDDGGIDNQGLRASAGITRVLLAVDQSDPAGPSAYLDDNVARLRTAGFNVSVHRPDTQSHAVTTDMKTAVLQALP